LAVDIKNKAISQPRRALIWCVSPPNIYDVGWYRRDRGHLKKGLAAPDTSNDVTADDIGDTNDDPGPLGNNLGQREGQGEGTRGRPILLLEGGSADDPIVL
jgi:hypothetical protein